MGFIDKSRDVLANQIYPYLNVYIFIRLSFSPERPNM